jgi:hypothetical protein
MKIKKRSKEIFAVDYSKYRYLIIDFICEKSRRSAVPLSSLKVNP